MILITNDEELTEEMLEYEETTGKKAKWHGIVTEGFKKWVEGEKIYGIDKKGIGVLVSESTKSKWEKFAEEFGFSTISNLIRESVEFYIEFQLNKKKIYNFSHISHDLKEPLTAIQGFLHLIIENEANKVNSNILLKIKDVYNLSLNLEEKINDVCTDKESKRFIYDILVIDDDRFTIEILDNYFESRGYKIKGVQTGILGLEELHIFKPKLVLLDIILPDINGFEICKKIKTNDQLKDIIVYYITAIPEADVKMNMQNTGADGYLLKPFKFQQFEDLLKFL